NAWWRANAAAGKASVLFAYAFGKAQRILHGIDAGIGPLLVHGAVEPLNAVYRAAGVRLPETRYAGEIARNDPLLRQALVIAPPSAGGSTWMRRFGELSDAFASGWMLLRGTRRRRGVDRGFALSDHADWPGLLWAIEQTGAERVMVTHGQVDTLVRYLCEQGLDARAFATEYGEEDDAPAAEDAPCRPSPNCTRASTPPPPATPSCRRCRTISAKPTRPMPPGRCISWLAASRASWCRRGCSGSWRRARRSCRTGCSRRATRRSAIWPKPSPCCCRHPAPAATRAWPGGCRSSCCPCAACRRSSWPSAWRRSGRSWTGRACWSASS